MNREHSTSGSSSWCAVSCVVWRYLAGRTKLSPASPSDARCALRARYARWTPLAWILVVRRYSSPAHDGQRGFARRVEKVGRTQHDESERHESLPRPSTAVGSSSSAGTVGEEQFSWTQFAQLERAQGRGFGRRRALAGERVAPGVRGARRGHGGSEGASRPGSIVRSRRGCFRRPLISSLLSTALELNKVLGTLYKRYCRPHNATTRSPIRKSTLAPSNRDFTPSSLRPGGDTRRGAWYLGCSCSGPASRWSSARHRCPVLRVVRSRSKQGRTYPSEGGAQTCSTPRQTST